MAPSGRFCSFGDVAQFKHLAHIGEDEPQFSVVANSTANPMLLAAVRG
jgi:hypothetical protein